MRLARVSRWIVASGLVMACSSHEAPAVTSGSRSAAGPAETRDDALALVIAYAERTHPGQRFTLVEETQGGGLDGPWVFQLAPAIDPLLVHYKTSEVVVIPPNPNGLKPAVMAWEKATYGHYQR